VEKLISTLDQPTAASLGVKTYTIANAKASDLVNKLRTLLSGPLATQIGTASTYQPDDRTNQVILIADKREHAFFDQLIAKLDAEASPNTRSEVIFLKHANATEVATLLSQLITGQTTASSRQGGSSGGGTRTTSQRNASGNKNAQGGAPATPPAPAAVAAVNAAAASEEFSSYLTIVADERSNAIVVAGTPNDIKLVASLVDRIDVLLAQVRIEVVIAEVTLKDDKSTGISQLGLSVKDNKLVEFSGSFAGGVISGSGADTSGNPTGFASIVQNANGSYDLSGIVNLKSSATKTDSSILQTPSIVTTHNEEAEIFVGETRPVISGTTSGASGSVSGLTTSSTIQQQEIGVRLTITPLIGSNGDVQLEIAQTVEDVAGEIEIDGNKQPIISRTETKSYIGAKNGEIIVLGGLQRTTESRSRNRLGPIPIIGDLLGLRSKSKARKELIFFLRPSILTNTALDNVEALKRLDATPIAKDVRAVLEQRPAAVTAPEAPAEASAPATK
jgi:general secretion pathway protein D